LVQPARQFDAFKEVLINEIATEWQEKVQSSKNGRRLNLSTLIHKNEAHELTYIEISSSFIHWHISQFSHLMLAPKPHLSKMHQPLGVSEGISLANSLIDGTEWENVVVEFKTKRGLNPLDKDGNKNPNLGQKWYANIWKSNAHLLEKKKEHKFSNDQSDLSIYHNFIQMYGKVYDSMEKTGGAEKLSEPVWVLEKQLKTE